jgi:glycosyltransferase involved in cell wall biosynthesis
LISLGTKTDLKVMYSIAIPCYNEKENLSLILNRFYEVIADKNIEVILVNNGSTDGSKEELDRLMPKYNFAKTVNLEVNKGYGFGILCGLAEARGEFIGWTHADMQTDPADVVKAFEIVWQNKNQKNLFVKGSRKGRGFFTNIFSVGMSIFETVYLKTALWEVNAQPNVFHRSFYESWKNPPHDFFLDLFVYYQAKKQRLNIKRLTVNFPPRIHGVSSWDRSIKDKVKAAIRTIKYSKKLKWES